MIIHAGAVPNHITDATTKALHDMVTPALIATTVTCHTGDHYHIEAYQPTPEIIACPYHTCHINQVRIPHLNPHPVPAGQQSNLRIRSKRGSKMMILSQIIIVQMTPQVILKMI